MPKTSETAAFDRAVGPLLDILLPDKAEAVLSFKPTLKLRSRIEALARKSTEGTLTAAERAEYAGYVRANCFAGILRKRARSLAKV